MDLTDRTLITEDDIRSAAAGTTLRIATKALVTPLAADLARERHITLERVTASSPGRTQTRRIAIGADHGGFEMKEALKKVLEGLGCTYQDFGTNSTAAVDYPDFAEAVALAVARGTCDLGIMVDGAGIGSCMVANKNPRRSRRHVL
jgi:ribose 5-phosphate isomerase B